MQLAGVTAGSSLFAGCFDGGPTADDPRDGGHRGGGTDDGTGDDGGLAIEPGTDIEFSAQTSHWEGLAPSSIEGAQNPTLIPQAGADYTSGWTKSDGASHTIELRDENDEIVDGFATDVVTEPDPNQILENTANSEMAQSVCAHTKLQCEGSFESDEG